MLRDEFQTALQDLEDLGYEQLQRLADFEPEELCPDGPDALKTAMERRRALLDRLADLSRRRGDLPGEGNRERAQFSAAIDHMLEAAGLRDGALSRLARGEREYRNRIRELSRLHWKEDEREVLEALASNAEKLEGLLGTSE